VVAVWRIAEPEEVERRERDEREAQAALEKQRAALDAEARAAAETRERNIAALAGAPESAPKHQPSTQERPVIPGDPGAIRQWLVLAPLPFEGDADLNVLKQQIPNESRLRPRAGERPLAAPAGLTWTAARLGEDSYQLDFVELAKKAKPESNTDHQVAYAVAYIVGEAPQIGLTLLVGSDDGARIYLNEKEIYRHLDDSSFASDRDEVSGVELKAGLNVLVLKVANGAGEWAGSVRLLDAAGQPVKGLTVTLDPDGQK
jgi:hypothetical protein